MQAQQDITLATQPSPHEQALTHFLATERHALGGWLDSLPWDHFITLTFHYPPAADQAQRRIHRWLRWTEQRLLRSIDWFYVLEISQHGFLHIHALTAGTQGSGVILGATWQHGRSDVQAYQAHLGAAHYLAKQLGRPSFEYDFMIRTTIAKGLGITSATDR